MFAMFVEQRLDAHQILPQPVGLAQRLFVIVCDGGEKRRDFDAIEAAEGFAKTLLSKVERTHIHM